MSVCVYLIDSSWQAVRMMQEIKKYKSQCSYMTRPDSGWLVPVVFFMSFCLLPYKELPA